MSYMLCGKVLRIDPFVEICPEQSLFREFLYDTSCSEMRIKSTALLVGWASFD